jgi:hypothetical protein
MVAVEIETVKEGSQEVSVRQVKLSDLPESIGEVSRTLYAARGFTAQKNWKLAKDYWGYADEALRTYHKSVGDGYLSDQGKRAHYGVIRATEKIIMAGLTFTNKNLTNKHTH